MLPVIKLPGCGGGGNCLAFGYTVVDELTKRRLLAFGPNKLAAELEGSKVFSKAFMRKYEIPTAEAEVCTTRAEAEKAVKVLGLPCVFKADGLAAGKGVIVTDDRAEALAHAAQYLPAGPVLVEEFLSGDEAAYRDAVARFHTANEENR